MLQSFSPSLLLQRCHSPERPGGAGRSSILSVSAKTASEMILKKKKRQKKHLTRSPISVQSAGPAVASSRPAASAAMAAERRAGRLELCRGRQRGRERGREGERGGWRDVFHTVLSLLNTDTQLENTGFWGERVQECVV